VRLAGIVSEASGAFNEDAAGFIARDGNIIAAWVIDGVTGINDRNVLPGPSDVAWLAERIDDRLRLLVPLALQLPELLKQLVDGLMREWQEASAKIGLPDGFDMPAACLLLVMRFSEGWKVLRLGDSILLVEDQGKVVRVNGPPTELGQLEDILRQEARRLRGNNSADFKALLRDLRPQLLASRMKRNTPGNHSILLPEASSLALPEYAELGNPSSILLCTDGFYRAVDTYGIADETGLVAACKTESGVNVIVSRIRAVESGDPDCHRHPRFKPADDASAVMIVRLDGE
jgi:hypothetical protein